MSQLCIDIRSWHTPRWGLLFADDLVLCGDSTVEVEDELEKWRRVLEENGLKNKQWESLRPRNCQYKIYLLRKRLPTAESFNYLGSTIQAEGGCEKDVTNRIRAGWNRWREMSGVIYDKKVREVLKSKSVKQQLDPQWHMVGNVGRWENVRKTSWTKPVELINEDAEIDTRKNKKIQHKKYYHPGRCKHKTNKYTFLMKKRLSWFGHVQRRDDDNVATSVLNTRIDGSRPRGRPKLRWMDRLKDDMKQNKIRPEWASDRENWFEMMKNVNILPGKRRKGETGEKMQCVQLTVESIKIR